LNNPKLTQFHNLGLGYDRSPMTSTNEAVYRAGTKAARSDDVVAMQCLWSNHSVTPAQRESFVTSATFANALSTLRWLVEVGRCDVDESHCNAAAFKGHLAVVQYLRSRGCPWSKWTALNAADRGHLEFLKWAHQNGCPWDPRWMMEMLMSDRDDDVMRKPKPTHSRISTVAIQGLGFSGSSSKWTLKIGSGSSAVDIGPVFKSSHLRTGFGDIFNAYPQKNGHILKIMTLVGSVGAFPGL